MEQKKQPKGAKRGQRTATLPYNGTNYTLIAIGIFIIALGFLLLYVGSITLAPILLVVGYCVIIPLGLLLKGKRANSSAGRERLVYTQEVGGSNPLSPKKIKQKTGS